MGTTICVNCEHASLEEPSPYIVIPQRRWVCEQVWTNYVTGDREVYKLCSEVNRDGECPQYVRRAVEGE